MEPTTQPLRILTTRFRLRSGTEDAFTSWQAEVVTAALNFQGFMYAEVKPLPTKTEWMALQRFTGQPELEDWRKSPGWKQLLENLKDLLEPDSNPVEETLSEEPVGRGGITEVIVTKVKVGMQDEYRKWETEIQRAQAKFPGYLGSYIQPPTPGGDSWTTLMRFDTPARLDAWLNSSERAELIKKGEHLVDYAHLHQLSNSFPGWFPSDPATGKGPANWKAAMLVLLGLFPIVLLEIKFFNPLLHVLNSAVATFIANSLSVALTTWGTMPLFIKAFSWWLFPAPDSPKSTEMRGTLLIFFLFVIEIAILWGVL